MIIDAVRCAKLALDNGIGGPLIAPSSYFMKTPPKQFTDDQARRMTEEFIDEYTPKDETSSKDETSPKEGSGSPKSEHLPAVEDLQPAIQTDPQSNGGRS